MPAGRHRRRMVEWTPSAADKQVGREPGAPTVRRNSRARRNPATEPPITDRADEARPGSSEGFAGPKSARGSYFERGDAAASVVASAVRNG